MAKKKDFIWQLYSDSQLRIWPENNFALNLNGSQRKSVFMPQKIFNNRKGITMAKELPVDILGKHQILTMGFAEHTKGYYHSRINKGFYDIMIVIDGALEAKTDDKKQTLKTRQALILPPNHLCDSFVEKTLTRVMYIHLEANSRWGSRLGTEFLCKDFNHFEEILALINFYKNEVLSERPNLLLLERIAECITIYLEREFPIEENSAIDIHSWILTHHSKNECKLSNIAKFFNVSKGKIDSECQLRFGTSFKKTVINILLEKSIEMIKQGKTNVQIAKELGYSDAYAFSKAFKNKYGVAPKNFVVAKK